MKETKNKGITLIALVITIIVLLILAGISIAMLTGENGILTKATEADIQTDIIETKEQIKLEVMGNADVNGNYTNANVIEAVKKITDNEIEEKTQMVQSKKGNSVDISDLWRNKRQITFSIRNEYGEETLFSVPENTTWGEFLVNCDNYDWSAFRAGGDATVEEIIKEYIDYGWMGEHDYIDHNSSFFTLSIWSDDTELVWGSRIVENRIIQHLLLYRR